MTAYAAASGLRADQAGSATRRQNLVAPGERGRFPEHCGHRAVFVFAELDGVPDGAIIELAAQAVEDFELGPDRGRLLSALARTDDFERVQLLALLFENGHDVGGGAGAERHEQEFHRAGSLVGLAVGIEGYGVARGAGGHEFLLAT